MITDWSTDEAIPQPERATGMRSTMGPATGSFFTSARSVGRCAICQGATSTKADSPSAPRRPSSSTFATMSSRMSSLITKAAAATMQSPRSPATRSRKITVREVARSGIDPRSLCARTASPATPLGSTLKYCPTSR